MTGGDMPVSALVAVTPGWVWVLFGVVLALLWLLVAAGVWWWIGRD